MGHLAFSKCPPLTIANQTDPDCVRVVMRPGLAYDMSPSQLMVPSETSVDFSISKAISIPNEEVVAQPLVSKLNMPAMDGFGGAKRLTKVVNDDGLPPIVIQRNRKIKD
jgi:hypothetical protein